jgi:hypothetical protein
MGEGSPAVLVTFIYLREHKNILKFRARIFKLLRSSRNDSKESKTPAYVAWQADTTLFLLGS